MAAKTGYIEFPGGRLAVGLVASATIDRQVSSRHGDRATIVLVLKGPGDPVLTIRCGDAPGQPRPADIVRELGGGDDPRGDALQDELAAWRRGFASMAEKARATKRS